MGQNTNSAPVFERMVDGTLVKFTSFGCYPVYYVSANGEDVLCAACANEDERDEDEPVSPSAADINWEDPDMHCDECSERIESAYAERDAHA